MSGPTGGISKRWGPLPALLLGLLLAGCLPDGETDRDAPHIAPDFRLPTLDGGELRSGDPKGGAMALHFFASWCPPCGEEAPALERLHRELAAAGIRFAGIAVRDTRERARNFVHRNGLTFPVVLDETGKIQADHGVIALPATLLIDSRGRIAARFTGETDQAAIRRALDPSSHSNTKETP